MTTLKKLFRRFARKTDAGGCRACGTCCEVLGPTVKASEADFERWRAEGRAEIAAWALTPEEARPEGCPFLARDQAGNGLCSVHSTKPEMCGSYPTEAHGSSCVMRIKHTHTLGKTDDQAGT